MSNDDTTSHIHWTMEKDRKLMMYVVEAYYKASADSRVEIEIDAAATRFECSVRAIEERLKKIRKHAQVETDETTDWSVNPYTEGSRRYPENSKASMYAVKKTGTPASKKGKKRFNADRVVDGESEDTTESGYETPVKKCKRNLAVTKGQPIGDDFADEAEEVTRGLFPDTAGEATREQIPMVHRPSRQSRGA